MDSYREHPNDFDVTSASDSSPSDEVGADLRTLNYKQRKLGRLLGPLALKPTWSVRN